MPEGRKIRKYGYAGGRVLPAFFYYRKVHSMIEKRSAGSAVQQKRVLLQRRPAMGEVPSCKFNLLKKPRFLPTPFLVTEHTCCTAAAAVSLDECSLAPAEKKKLLTYAGNRGILQIVNDICHK